MVAEAIDGVMRRIRRLEALEYSSGKSDGNILTNPGFEIWQRGTGPFIANGYTADRWKLDGTGATVSLAPNALTIPEGSVLSARLVFTPGVATLARLYQHIENSADYHELTVGFTAKIYASVANVARIYIRDNAVYTYSQYHSGVAGWEYLSVTKLLSASIPDLAVGLEVGPVGCTVFIDNTCLMVGAALPYSPCHPSDDWDRCLRYYETGHLCWRGYTPDAGGIWLPLTFVERKCDVPVITMSGGVYDIYGTVSGDALVALDENTMCWQLVTTGVGIGEVQDRHWIAEANCEPVNNVLYFTPGNLYDEETPNWWIQAELWKYDGTSCTFLWAETDSSWDENWITSLFWSTLHNTMYMCTWSVDDSKIRIYSIDPVTDAVTLLYEEVTADVNPIIDAVEFDGNLYVLLSGYYPNTAEVRVWDPSAITLTNVFTFPETEYAGGLAVDPVENQLLAYGGYVVYYSDDGTVWNLDQDLEPIYDNADSMALVTYQNKVYLSCNAGAWAPGVGNMLLRRDGVGNWVDEYTDPLGSNCSASCCPSYNAVGDIALFSQGWGWGFSPAAHPDGLANIFRKDLGGAWVFEWGGPGDKVGDSWYAPSPQGLAYCNGKMYGLWFNRTTLQTALWERQVDGTWTLVQTFTQYDWAPTHSGTLAIAIPNNTLKKPHEV